MIVEEMIDMLKRWPKEARVMAWSPEQNEYCEVTGLVFKPNDDIRGATFHETATVELQTDGD